MSVSRFVVRHSLMSVLLVLLAACGSGSSAGGGGTSTPPPGGGTPPTTPEVPQPEPPAPTASIGSCEATGAARTAERLARMRPGTLGQFVVAFDGKAGVTPAQKALLQTLPVRGAYTLNRLPIAGIVATREAAQKLMATPGVRSLRFNDPVTLDDEAANMLTSVTRAQAQTALVNAEGQPYTGKGISILVNDSGIDGTHQDLQFGGKLLQNALGHLNGLGDVVGINPNMPIENVPNTDVLGSHGSHVAGIAAGDGTASAGLFTGSAKGASLIGYGSGAALFVLDTLGGFDYAMQILDTHPEYNLRIVTNSFGNTGDVGTCFDPADPTNIATKALSDRGVIVVFSAGNSGSGPDTITGNFKKAPWVLAAANAEKSGLLAPSSSRGSLARGSYFTEVDGERLIVNDRPTVVTPGTNYISARAVAADPFTPLDTEADISSGAIPLELIPFYTQKTGTSMAAPHLAGLVALLLEANPALTWREIKPIFEKTATNMPGYEPWEVGAGMANVEAALAMALSLRRDYGVPNHTQRGFFASIALGESTVTPVSVAFAPAGAVEPVSFEVGADDSLVLAQWTQPEGNACTCAIVLTDPDGNRYGSSIALPVLGATVATSAPAKAGTWQFSVSGIGSLSGVSLDPLGVTNGIAGPGTVDATLTVFKTGTTQGLADIRGRSDQTTIEFAVAKRLVDGLPAGFTPDALLTRRQLAEYLMAFGVRQTREPSQAKRYTDTTGFAAAVADAVTAPGQLLMDLSPEALPPLAPASNGKFNPAGTVSRQQAAFALVQAIGRQALTAQYEGMDLFAFDAEGNTVPVADAADVDPALRNHVQDAIALGILDVQLSQQGGATVARINPKGTVSRAAYAGLATRAYNSIPFPE